MKDLDDRLREISVPIKDRDGNITARKHLDNEAIAQIHKALDEAGWLNPLDAKLAHEALRVTDKVMEQMMTGQEWYGRIDRDLLRSRILGTSKTFNQFTEPELILELLYKHFDAAAKKAAGLDKEKSAK